MTFEEWIAQADSGYQQRHKMNMDWWRQVWDAAQAAQRETDAVAICPDCQLALVAKGDVKPAEPDATLPGNWVHPIWDFGIGRWFYTECKAAAIRTRGEGE